MCDSDEDLDDYIEYEFARDCIEIDEDFANDTVDGNDIVQSDPQNIIVSQNVQLPEDVFLYDEAYEIVEELDDEFDQTLISDTALDIKAEISDQSEQDTRSSKPRSSSQEAKEEHLIEVNPANGDNQEEELHEIEYEEMGGDDNTDSELVIPEKVEPKIEKNKRSPIPCPEDKGPKGAARKYLLYDELVATIVDYDTDGTPIVEFSVSSNDSDEKLPIECGICPDVMIKSKITAHLKTHLLPGTNRYQCIYCEETYKDCKYLAGHARRHMGIRPYVCELCKLYFSTKQDLRVHNQRRHQEKDHICEVCGKTFAQNTQLKRHREATHEKKRRFKCDICPKSYYKNFSLQEHIRAVHMGKRRIIVCPFCGMQCRDAHKMARHRKQYHLHQTQFECHICNEEFTDINYFDAHKRSIQCRNNTRRKQEEEGMLQQQEEHRLEEPTEQTTEFEVTKHEILLEDDNSQQYSQNSNDKQHLIHQIDHSQQHIDDDAIETVQIIDECDYKHLISSSPPHQDHTGHFMLTDDLLDHKIEEISSDDIADDELVYEITIDSNE